MVEWKKLGEIGDVCMCKRIMKHQTFDKGDVPFFKIGTFGGNADAFINRDLFLEYKSKFSFPQKGDILLSASGTIGRTVVYNGEEAYFQDSNIVWISNDESQVTNAFLYYCYQIVDWKIDGGTIKRLYNYNLKNTIIPVPSFSEQNRIVSILDTFTVSIENLKEQIAQRRKQYEYYRDQLLDLEGKEGVEMKTLGETCIIKNGYTPSTKEPSFWENGTLPWFTLEDIRKNGRILKDAIKHITSLGVKRGGLFPKDSIIISTTATIGEYALIKSDFLCNQQITCLTIKEEMKGHLLPKYLYYLSDGIGKWCKSHVNGGGSLLIVSTSKLIGLQVPLPTLLEQQRIVSILDTFEASIANLEAQLSQREKQYEYYRNKLLTFE